MTVHAIIPAGGRASRTGPLAAQISKALISMGNQPHLVRQILQLRESGVDGDIVVVVSPDTLVQIDTVLIRCGLAEQVRLVVQDVPRGPIDAMSIAFRTLPYEDDSSTIVLMSDTYLNEHIPVAVEEWVGVSRAESDRRFCYDKGNGNGWVDGECREGAEVFIGAIKLSTQCARVTCDLVLGEEHDRELGLSVFLNAFCRKPPTFDFHTWHDTGDVMALIRARSAAFISRDRHALALNGSTITKYGSGVDFRDQMMKVETLTSLVPELLPTLHGIKFASDKWSMSYTMDYIEVPSLAELWLYWPGNAQVWTDILDHVIVTLSDSALWRPRQKKISETQALEREFYVDKPITRMAGAYPEFEKALLEADLQDHFDGSPIVTGHGDLNFGNIFFSMNSGSVKLIDPRGCPVVPLSYELGKLAFSFDAGLSAFTHGLDPEKVDATHWAEIDAMRDLIVKHTSIRDDPRRLAAIQASMTCSSIPLHPVHVRPYMEVAATRLFDIALG